MDERRPTYQAGIFIVRKKWTNDAQPLVIDLAGCRSLASFDGILKFVLGIVRAWRAELRGAGFIQLDHRNYAPFRQFIRFAKTLYGVKTSCGKDRGSS
jgi:hypothetical protein